MSAHGRDNGQDPHEEDLHEDPGVLPPLQYALSEAESVYQDAAQWLRFYERGLHGSDAEALTSAAASLRAVLDQLRLGIEHQARITTPPSRVVSPAGVSKLTDAELTLEIDKRLPASTAALKRAGLASTDRIERIMRARADVVRAPGGGRNAEWRRRR